MQVPYSIATALQTPRLMSAAGTTGQHGSIRLGGCSSAIQLPPACKMQRGARRCIMRVSSVEAGGEGVAEEQGLFDMRTCA